MIRLLFQPGAASMDVARFEPLLAQIRMFSGIFVRVLVLVLSVSGTRTRMYRIDYEYHFIEYERLPTSAFKIR
jgi:hypothetical protein